MHSRRRLKYKGMTVNLFGLPDYPSEKNKPNTNPNPKRHYLRSFSSEISGKILRNLLLVYDIPEERKKERDWFRRQLMNLGFVMIQRSVWVGPSPLSKEFLDYLKKIGLQKEFKTFKL